MFRSTLIQKTSLMMATQSSRLVAAATPANAFPALARFLSDSTQMYTGTVKWFDAKKGFGFIVPDDGSDLEDDVFCHQTTIHAEGFRSLAVSCEWK